MRPIVAIEVAGKSDLDMSLVYRGILVKADALLITLSSNGYEVKIHRSEVVNWDVIGVAE